MQHNTGSGRRVLWCGCGLQSSWPWLAAAERRWLSDWRSRGQLRLQVILKLQEVEEVTEEVVEHVRLISLSDCVPVDSCLGELETKPLERGRGKRGEKGGEGGEGGEEGRRM